MGLMKLGVWQGSGGQKYCRQPQRGLSSPNVHIKYLICISVLVGL